MTGVCSVEDCPRPARARGLCKMHHALWRRHGDPTHPTRYRRPFDTPFEEWFRQQFRDDGECRVWTRRTNEFGYGVVKPPWQQAPERTHRIVWMLTNGPIPDSLEILHLCDNPPCGRIEHLRLDTHAENMADAAQKGRIARGERKIGQAILTDDEVRKIRSSYTNGMSAPNLAREYRVSESLIYKIISKDRWKHVE